MADILGPLSMCLGGLSFVLSTVPTAAKVVNNHRERSRHADEIKIRLGACQAKFGCWEGHWRTPSLQVRGLSEEIVTEVKDLRAALYDKIDGSEVPEAQKKAWKNTKSRLRKKMCARPQRFAEELCSAVWYDLWGREDLDRWVTRLERIISAVDELFNKDFDKRTAGHFNTMRAQDSNLKDLETSSSRLFDLGRDLYEICIKEPSTFGWAFGLKPPKASCDISRWSVAIPIDIELRFSITRDRPVREQYRLHVRHQPDSPKTTTLNEAKAQILKAKDSSFDDYDPSFRPTLNRKHDRQVGEQTSIGDLLESHSSFFRTNAWRLDRAGLGLAISEWSLRLWDTPWLDNFCCHGIFLIPYTYSDDFANHYFESKVHGDCQSAADNNKARNLGLAWAQLVLGQPIKPVSGTDLEFQMRCGEEWKFVQRSDINLEILMATGSESLQEAIDFCLKPESRMFNQQFEPGFLFKCIDSIHKPIKAWYEEETKHLKGRLASVARKDSITGARTISGSREVLVGWAPSSTSSTIKVPVFKGETSVVPPSSPVPKPGSSTSRMEHKEDRPVVERGVRGKRGPNNHTWV